MPHAPAGGGGATGDKANHGLLAPALGLIGNEPRGVLLGGPADFADHKCSCLDGGPNDTPDADTLGGNPGDGDPFRFDADEHLMDNKKDDSGLNAKPAGEAYYT